MCALSSTHIYEEYSKLRKKLPSYKIQTEDTPYEFVVFINRVIQENLFIYHKEIFALTFYLDNCVNLTEPRIIKVNALLTAIYPNALCMLTRMQRSLYLSLNNKPIQLLNDYGPMLTLQARSREDTCLQIINLEQNYRWETNHHYNDNHLTS